MASSWEMELNSGHTWHVGSWIADNSDAQIIIPVDQIDGLTDAEIGAYVRSLIETARLCHADELAYELLRDPTIYEYDPERTQEFYAYMLPYRAYSERIEQAIDLIDNRRVHPISELIRSEKRKAKPKTDGYVYLIKAETGHYKIGRTKSIDQRMDFFGVKLPFNFGLVHTIKTTDMYKTEQQLHTKFGKKRINGEWFDLSPEDVAWICSL